MFEEQSEDAGREQIIWNTLRSLPDGEHILGRDLREMSGIKDVRTFYKVIEEFREAGIFIGANRQSPVGYYEIRTDNDMIRFLSSNRAEINKKLETLNAMERKWYRKVIPNYMEEDGA